MKSDLAPPFYSRVECGSPIPSLEMASLMKAYFYFCFYEYCTRLHVVYIVVISWIFLCLLCWLFICLMAATMYVSYHVSTCM